MAKTKSELSLLDNFILSLIRDKVNTLYLIHREAGISIGAASPVLRYLQRICAIGPPLIWKGRRPKPEIGPRGKVVFEPGVLYLSSPEDSWFDKMEKSLPVDVESIGRFVALAEEGKRPDVARKALKNAIRERQKRASRPAPPPGRSSIANRYRSIVQACESARLKAEARALKEILAGLK